MTIAVASLHPAQMPTLEIKVPGKVGGHIDAVDELRGLAILLVILYHAGGVLVWQNFFHGDVGVDIFVILSGVGIALSTRVETAGTFLRRRLIRIFPAYWIVLTAFLLGNIYLLHLPYTAFNVAVHYLGIHALFGDAIGFSIDDSFWFITLILGWYAIYALFRRWLNKPDLIVFWGGILSAIVAYAYFETGQSGCFGHIGLRFPGFFAGLMIGILLREGRLDVPLSPALAAGLLAAIYVPYTHGIIFAPGIVGFALAIGYLFLWRVRAQAELVGTVARDLRFLGRYSLEIFLIHQPLIRDYNYYVQSHVFNDPNPSPFALIVGMLIALTVTLFISARLHRLLDRSASARGTVPAGP
jgi:peptidoglycan/LPS O-acetylase OafA/YrhL